MKMFNKFSRFNYDVKVHCYACIGYSHLTSSSRLRLALLMQA